MALGAAQISLRAISTEFVGPATGASLRAFRRGGSYVRDKAANDSATNMAAAVSTTTTVSMRSFRSAARLFKYTNSAVINNSSMQAWFGDDWNVDYPKEFVNNNACHATSTANWGFRVDGGLGTKRLTNNGNILGAGAPTNSSGVGEAGGNALYCNATLLTVANNSQIFAGGGSGGKGGTGGTGGTGYTQAPNISQEGPAWSPPSYVWSWNPTTGNTYLGWAGVNVALFAGEAASHVVGAYTYYKGTFRSSNSWEIYRQWISSYTNTYYSGGAGGAGGNGGRGYGADGANAAGAAGVDPGNNGGTNAGDGGNGGAGGTGGSWGLAGATGATGQTGQGGNWDTTGAAGTAGSAGGAAGYYLYRAIAMTYSPAGDSRGRLL